MELILLSPYRLPAQNALYLGNDDVAAWLNAYTALWHPAAALGAASPPHVGSPYDHEQPTAGHLYAIPETPPLILPEDWDERVRAAGAVAFRATPDRATTLANLRAALRERQHEATGARGALCDLDHDRAAPFLGVGFGYLMVEGLFTAMEHENLLAVAELWQDVQQAIAALPGGDAESVLTPLRSAANRLQSAREVLYPVNIYLLDLCLLDESRLAEPLPAAFDLEIPCNVVASGALFEKLAHEQPQRLERLRQRLAAELVEVCGGPFREREDALLPVESQLWNLVKGLTVTRNLLGSEPRIFGRRRFAAHPQLPALLTSVGLTRALLVAFDESVLPAYRATVVNWPAPDGRQLEAFARTPLAADNPQTFFHAAHHLHRTIMQDHSATLALLHSGPPDAPWYRDWLELSRLGPVLGRWTTLSRYLAEVLAGEYASAASADEFHGDYLSERQRNRSPQPVSGFATQVRWRRRLDTAWSLAALHRGLAGHQDTLQLDARLGNLEDQIESEGADLGPDTTELAADLAGAEKEAAEALAQRLVARATEKQPGFLVLNPCSFTRRLALEVNDTNEPIPVGGPVKACQLDGTTSRLVVEVPALGFCWFPRSGPRGAPPPASRFRLADERGVRNEFFEAEIDPATGGLRAIRDHRSRVNRLAEQLVFNPGSTMRCRSGGVLVTSTGPALGEVITEGGLLDEQGRVLATFRQRFRAWLGRPVLDLRIELYPNQQPQGSPWHSYYGARFAWRDERTTLLRSVNGTGYITTHTRPQTPDYLELRLGGQSTVLFPGGLPFQQRHGARMLDVLLFPEGETVQVFDLAIGLDRDFPMQTALGMVTPATVVPTRQGPPHVGATGWLFHLDAPQLLLLNLRPVADGQDGILARLLDCGGQGGHAEFRCVRDPNRAELLDAHGAGVRTASVHGDAVSFEVSPGELVQLRVDW